MSRIFRKRALPGFGLTLGFTIAWLSLIILIPFSALALKTFQGGWTEFWKVALDPRVLASYRLSFGASAIAALINGVFGLLAAWVLVRYSFPGKRLIDALVDLPFALPTAVAGIALTSIYAGNGWIGSRLELVGIKGAFSPFGVTVALTFIGLPFVVRTLQPVVQELAADVEEAAATLGANRWQTLRRVVLPALMPAWITGVMLAFGRAVGEYGSVVFISGNLPYRTEITPLLIVSYLEEFNYHGAAALGFVMLLFSFVILSIVQGLQAWQRRRSGVTA
jgi:sulfate/thiosulfate transport system permease protein